MKGSALGVSGDERKEVFALTTTTTGKLPTVSKKRDSQSSVPPRRQKTAKKSTTYDRILKKTRKFNNPCIFKNKRSNGMDMERYGNARTISRYVFVL